MGASYSACDASSFSDSVPFTSDRPPFWQRFKRSFLPNPGNFEDLNNDASMVLRPNLFDGFQANINIPLTPSGSFSVGQGIDMGSQVRPNNYSFSANYMTQELVMISRVDLSGRVNGRIFYTHTPSLVSKITADVGSEPHSSRVTYDLDYRTSDACLQGKIGNGTLLGLSYLQSITPSVALGAEGTYHGKAGFSALSFAGKYNTEDDVATLSIATYGPVVATFVHKVGAKVALAAEVFWDAKSRESVFTAGYKFDLKDGTVTGQVDTTGRIAALLQHRFDAGLSFLLSGEITYPKRDYKFGFGVQLGN